jgi:hypothetical protein
MLKRCIVVLGLVTSVNAHPPSTLAGTWEGLYNGQPERLQPDGSYPETRTKFRLVLYFSKSSKLTGALAVFGLKAQTSQIMRPHCDLDACSFEVVDFGDGTTPQAWRVWIAHGELRGIRNRGPLRPFGIGPGARLFKVEARRAKEK